MFPVRSAFAACLAVAALLASPALARDRVLSFYLSGGVGVAPSYFGSANMQAGPGLRFGFHGLRLGGLELGEPESTERFVPGTGASLAARRIGQRRGINELNGMTDVPAAIELGVRLRHTTRTWQTYVELRRGVRGHSALVGQVGANAILRGANGLVVNVGPRAEFGDASFMRTYFGVTPAEAALSGQLAAYRPGAGLQSVGIEIGAYQPLNANWGITASLRLSRLQGDAAASPIVRQGRRDQAAAAIGLTRHFTLRF